MSTTTSVICRACGVTNDVLVPDDSFDEQMKYAALQFACRVCGESLSPAASDPEADSTPKPQPR